MNVLEVHGLTKLYRKKPAVNDLTFAVQQGQIFGFLGPNGSGKTTTLAMIFGVIRPTRGTISVFGDSSGQALARGRLGGMLEQPNLYPYLTGRENLKVVAAIKGLDHKLIEPALGAVDLLDAAARPAKGYSLGMKQRLALAAAMLGDPEILVLDEPTNGLDPAGMSEIRELVLRLSRSGRTILLSTHLLDEVEKICTHVAILNFGSLQRSCAVKDLTSAHSAFRLCAEDTAHLFEAVSQYEAASNVRMVGDAVHVDLTGGSAAGLNRYLAGRDIYLNELTPQRQTLEQAFLAATRPAAATEAGEHA